MSHIKSGGACFDCHAIKNDAVHHCSHSAATILKYVWHNVVKPWSCASVEPRNGHRELCKGALGKGWGPAVTDKDQGSGGGGGESGGMDWSRECRNGHGLL